MEDNGGAREDSSRTGDDFGVQYVSDDGFVSFQPAQRGCAGR